MLLILQIIFWGCLLIMFYSYFLYPIFLKLLTRNKKQNEIVYTHNDELPIVALLLAAYNEEAVIREKVENTFDTDYPLNKLEVWVGSDCSSDKTDEILKELSLKYSSLKFIPFKQRTGKSQILNTMQQQCKAEILVFTDATTMYKKNTFTELVKHFKNPEIGLVSGNFVTYQKNSDNITQQEAQYLKRENEMKYREGLLGCVMGAFGPIFALRSSLYTNIPPGFMMDDFFLTLGVIDKGHKAIMEEKAIALEELETDIQQEYRRKKRFSIGNFRNHSYYTSFHNPFNSVKNWCYISHKYLRWIGPFIFLTSAIALLILAFFSKTYFIIASALLILLAFIAIDYQLINTKFQIKFIRLLLYFAVANWALLQGYLAYRADNQKSSTWKPSNR